MTHPMMALRKRFTLHPLLPNAVMEQQNRWRQRWGMQPKSLRPGEDWRYYFDPSSIQGGTPNDPRRRLRFALIHGHEETKYFLTGSKGAGKSTTAYALWDDPEIAKQYTLLGFTIHDYLNLAETDASQIIAVMIAHLVEVLRDTKEDAKLGELEARGVVKELRSILQKVKPKATVQQVNVNVFGWFTAIFKESASARSKFREYVDGNFDEVMELFDDLNATLEAHLQRKTLFIIDDLDKLLSEEVRSKVFQLQLPMLLRPRCVALYSYPIEVDHDPRFDSLKRGQPNRYVLANVKLVQSAGGPMLTEGRDVMTQLVLRRLEGRALSDVITLSSSQWDRVLHYTGGNFRELSRLLSHAFEIAAMEGENRANLRCFELALERVRADYNPFVQTYRGFLEQVHNTHKAPQATEELNPELLSKLLAAFAVVEYPNEPGWLGLNPVVADLLTARPSKL
ncbi:MAG: P-loop NTPase fold protein [Myxococcota bacterium]